LRNEQICLQKISFSTIVIAFFMFVRLQTSISKMWMQRNIFSSSRRCRIIENVMNVNHEARQMIFQEDSISRDVKLFNVEQDCWWLKFIFSIFIILISWNARWKIDFDESVDSYSKRAAMFITDMKTSCILNLIVMLLM